MFFLKKTSEYRISYCFRDAIKKTAHPTSRWDQVKLLITGLYYCIYRFPYCKVKNHC